VRRPVHVRELRDAATVVCNVARIVQAAGRGLRGSDHAAAAAVCCLLPGAC